MDGFEQQPFEQTPVEAPAPSASRRGLIIGVAAGVLLVAVLIAGFLFWRSSRKPSAEQALVNTRILNEEARCKAATDPEACRSQALLDISKETGRGDICGQLNGDPRDLCVYRDAQRNADAKRCQDLSSDELKAGCADAVLTASAQTTGDASLCGKISDANAAESCRHAFVSSMTSVQCREQGLDSAQCDALAKTEAAVAAGDYSLCGAIADADARAVCEDRVGPLDRDQDGLPAHDEAEYGTDPNNPDTDGDSFSDGVEVSGGYNPNGPGRL